MRTKSILLAAATIAAGALSSQAQSNVYSVNVVGYINITLKPGFNLISAPLQATNNNVNTVLANISPTLGTGDLFMWNATTGAGFLQAINPDGAGGWVDGNFNPATNQVPPGVAYFLRNGDGADRVLTLTGTVIQGTNNYVINKNFGFYGDPVPIVGDIVTNGFPVQNNTTLFTWNVTGQTYNQAVIGDSGAFVDQNFNPVVVAPALGEGFVYFMTNNNLNWTRSFTVQ
jgi:hypothetical protein